jgi:hypothetical protein
VKEFYPEKGMKWYLPAEVNDQLIAQKFKLRAQIIDGLKTGSLGRLKSAVTFFLYDDNEVSCVEEGTKLIFR